MKVAIVHDYIKEYGGAERVLESLCEVFPDAEVYSLIYLPSFLGPHRERFRKFQIHTSFLQYLPFKSKLISPLRIIAPLVFKSFDFSKFDVVIVSQTGAYTPNMINKKGAVQICYSHTPPRYLYGFATAREWKKNRVLKVAGELMNHVLRMVDFKSSQNVDYFIANSQNVADRIQKFYRRNSVVIYPPIDTKILSNKDIKEKSLNISISQYPNYFLCGGRIAKPKHIDFIVETFSELGLPLKIFGRVFPGHDEEFKIQNRSFLRNPKFKNIEFLGEISDEEKYELMRGAKAFIFASEDEDFGITPVEAMAVGTPVIAYRSGGVLESVIDPSAGSGQGATGIFFDKLTVQSLSDVIKKFQNMKFEHSEIAKHAQKFSKDRFKNEIGYFIKSKIKN